MGSNDQHLPLAWKKIKKLTIYFQQFRQGILKGEVSLYHWPSVWPVWNQLYDNRQFLFLFAKQTNPNQVNRRSNGTVILPPLVFPFYHLSSCSKATFCKAYIISFCLINVYCLPNQVLFNNWMLWKAIQVSLPCSCKYLNLGCVRIGHLLNEQKAQAWIGCIFGQSLSGLIFLQKTTSAGSNF